MNKTLQVLNSLQVLLRAGRLHRDGLDLGPAPEVPDGAAVRAMYRAESLRLTSGPAGGRVLNVAFAEATPMAGRVVVTGIADGRTRVSVLDAGRPAAQPGDPLLVALPERPDRLLDAATGRHLQVGRAS